MSFKRPGVSLGLLLIMFGFEQFLQTQNEQFILRSSMVNIGVGAVVLMAACTWLFRNVHRLRLDDVHIASFLLFGLAYCSQYWTLAPNRFEQYFMSAIPYVAMFLLIAPIISLGKDGIRVGVWTTLYFGIPLVFLFVFMVEWEGRGVRLAAPTMENGRLSWYSPPLALSTMAAYVGMLSIILVPKNFLLKVLHFVTFGLACYITFRTQSRGQLIALGLVTLICYPLANQATRLKGLFLTLGGISILAIALYLVFAFFDLGNINRWGEDKLQSDFVDRTEMLTTLLSKWARGGPMTIMFGLGSASAFVVCGFYVHNLPVEILGELGLVGASLFTFICIRVFVKSIRILKKLEHYPKMRREAIALIAMFLFSSIISLKQGSLYSWPQLFFLAIAISHLERHSRQFVARKQMFRQYFIRSIVAQSFNTPKYSS